MRHLQIYTAIETIVSHGSIRAAAYTLSISPSALNRQILAFEQDLGIELFDRVASGVRLSTAGEIYFQQFRAHVAELERAKTRVADLAGLRMGHVSIAASIELCAHFLPSQILRYREEFPAVSFSVISVAPGGEVDLLMAYRADLALVVQPDLSDTIQVLSSADRPLCGIYSTGERAPPTDPDRIEMMLEADLALPAPHLASRGRIDGLLRRRRLTVKPSLELEGPIDPPETGERALMQLWPLDDVPPRIARARNARLLQMRFLGVPSVRVVLAQRAGRPLPVAAVKFAGQIDQHLAQAAPDGP
ncbi:MAG: LysR family transcriptional regulator [Pseudomonadota bacterium]